MITCWSVCSVLVTMLSLNITLVAGSPQGTPKPSRPVNRFLPVLFFYPPFPPQVPWGGILIREDEHGGVVAPHLHPPVEDLQINLYSMLPLTSVAH
jgi:hypothetical protein